MGLNPALGDVRNHVSTSCISAFRLGEGRVCRHFEQLRGHRARSRSASCYQHCHSRLSFIFLAVFLAVHLAVHLAEIHLAFKQRQVQPGLLEQRQAGDAYGQAQGARLVERHALGHVAAQVLDGQRVLGEAAVRVDGKDAIAAPEARDPCADGDHDSREVATAYVGAGRANSVLYDFSVVGVQRHGVHAYKHRAWLRRRLRDVAGEAVAAR